MKLKLVREGSDLTAYAIETDDGCPFEDFLTALEADKQTSAYSGSIVAKLKHLLDNRAFRNLDLIKPIPGYENVLAITPNRVRALFGYAPDRSVLLSFGYMKGDNEKHYYKMAESLHKQAIEQFFPEETRNDQQSAQQSARQSRGPGRRNRTQARRSR